MLLRRLNSTYLQKCVQRTNTTEVQRLLNIYTFSKKELMSARTVNAKVLDDLHRMMIISRCQTIKERVTELYHSQRLIDTWLWSSICKK